MDTVTKTILLPVALSIAERISIERICGKQVVAVLKEARLEVTVMVKVSHHGNHKNKSGDAKPKQVADRHDRDSRSVVETLLRTAVAGK